MSTPQYIDSERNRNKKLKKELEKLKRHQYKTPLRQINTNRGERPPIYASNIDGGNSGTDDGSGNDSVNIKKLWLCFGRNRN